MEFPSEHSSKKDDGSDSGISGDKSKSLIKVYAFLLSEAMSYKSGLVLLNAAISSMLDFVEPS